MIANDAEHQFTSLEGKIRNVDIASDTKVRPCPQSMIWEDPNLQTRERRELKYPKVFDELTRDVDSRSRS